MQNVYDRMAEQTPLLSNPAFTRWFAKSKVVDGEGNPQKCFHYSAHSGFSSFKIEDNDFGIHFGSIGAAHGRGGFDPQGMRFSYEQYLDEFDDEGEPLDFDGFTKNTNNSFMNTHQPTWGSDMNLGHGIYPVYLRIQKPVVMPDLQMWLIDSVVGYLVEDSDLPDNAKDILESLDPDSPEYNFKSIRKILMKFGYDGVEYINEFEGDIDQDGDFTSWMVFSPNQIKSATGNSGTFSVDSDNLHEKSSKKADKPMSEKRTCKGAMRELSESNFASLEKAPDAAKGFTVFRNPSRVEMERYCGDGARGYIDKDGNFYIEGYTDDQEINSILHSTLLRLIASFGVPLESSYIRNYHERSYFSEDGITVEVYSDFRVYVGESVMWDGPTSSQQLSIIYDRAKKKNPMFTFVPSKVNDPYYNLITGEGFSEYGDDEETYDENENHASKLRLLL